MRPRTACTTCRRRQRRCITKEPLVACTYCAQRKIPCSLSVSSPDSSTSKTDPKSPHEASEATTWRPAIGNFNFASPGHSLELPPHDACVEIASAYFAYLHEPTQYLFHRASFLEDLKSGLLPRSVLLCVIALAARFSTSTYFYGIEPRLRGFIYAKEAARLLDLNDLSIDTIHTAVLLGTFYGADGDFMHESLYYAIACRLASLLRVPDLTLVSPLHRELQIRLWWTLEMTDVWASKATQLPRMFTPRNDIPYPIEESTFLGMTRNQDLLDFLSISPSSRSTSMLAEKLKLNSILAEVARLNRAAANKAMSSYELHAATENLAEKLTNWRQQLPLSLVNTPENLIKHAASGLGGAFVALYLGYYHFSMLLFYRYLHLPNVSEDTKSPGTMQVQSFAEQCHVNSTAFCETLYSAYATPGAEVYYAMVGHVLVISSTVQLHILLFSEDEIQMTAARKRLERNFNILCELQSLWRMLDMTFGRFREFHNACMKVKQNSGDPSSAFRLDKWMVGFLMEFSKPVEERPEEVNVAEDDLVGELGDLGLSEDEAGFDLRQWSLDTLGIDIRQ